MREDTMQGGEMQGEGMGGDSLMLNLQNYPDLQNLQEGDSGKLMIEYTVKSNDGENLEITTQNIENEMDESQQFHKNMSKQPGMGYNSDADMPDDGE